MIWLRWRWPLNLAGPSWGRGKGTHSWPPEPYVPLLRPWHPPVQQVLVLCSGRLTPGRVEHGYLYILGGGRSVSGPFDLDDPRFLILPAFEPVFVVLTY